MHIKFEFAALLHYTVNYNIMSQVEIKWVEIITEVFSSMRHSDDTSKWSITIMTSLEFQRCLYTMGLMKLLVGTAGNSIPQDKSFERLIPLLLNPTTRFRMYAGYLLRRDAIKSTPVGFRRCKHCHLLSPAVSYTDTSVMFMETWRQHKLGEKKTPIIMLF